MIKNLTTVKLLGILAVLVLIYLGFEFFGEKGRSKNYREALVEIDTSNVDKIVIEKGGKSLSLLKEGGAWNVSIGPDRFAKATSSSVERLIDNLLSIRASRIVARDENKWKDYQVDSAGTHVQVYEKNAKSLDIILGRFGFQSQRDYSTYVRLSDEPEVYAADNFMAMSINPDATSYRNSQVARIRKDSVTQIAFHYPDSAFVLTKDSANWKIDNIPTDSASTAQFFNAVSSLNGSNFYDDSIPSGEAPLSVTITTTNGGEITLNAYSLPEENWVVHSSANPESYFADEALFDKIFKNREYFVKRP